MLSSNKKRAREKKKKSTSSRKRRRKNAKKSSSKYALDLTIAMIATITVSLVDAINPTIATWRRERKLDNGKNFRDYRIDPKDFVRNPLKYGLKILEELAELGGNSGTSTKSRVNNRVFRCVTCGHSDYEDGMIVYAIFIQENVARTLVGRITWVCDYGMAILRDYDCRIIARKNSKNDKTAYAMVKIPIDGKMKLVKVHALLFNKVLLDKENRRGIFRETDHIDNSDEATNGLNNLLVNVRDGAPDGTRRLNLNNRSTRNDNTSGHKGVYDYKGQNEGGSKGDFGYWQVRYNELDKVSKRAKEKSESKLFRRIKNGEAHKQKMFKKACEFREEKQRKYVDDLEEYYKPIRALHDLWFSADRDSDDENDDENDDNDDENENDDENDDNDSDDDTQDVVRSFERHWQSLRPSILELTRTSK